MKTYEFSVKGWNKAHSDAKSEKIGKYINATVWVVIGALALNGTITSQGMIKILACSGTSFTVKTLMNLKGD